MDSINKPQSNMTIAVSYNGIDRIILLLVSRSLFSPQMEIPCEGNVAFRCPKE
jgi:hypothetical protein